LANAVDQVILVVDVTDAVCLDIARRYAVDHPVTVMERTGHLPPSRQSTDS